MLDANQLHSLNMNRLYKIDIRLKEYKIFNNLKKAFIIVSILVYYNLIYTN